jgi:glutamate dehydrogenase (NAD(P)+)
MSQGELERLTRRYSAELFDELGPTRDIPAPDVGTNAQVMAWMMDTYSMKMGYVEPGVVTGKPIVLGGSQGREEATGRGIVVTTREALKDLGIPFEGVRVVVQGFGNVGSHAARYLADRGAILVAASDLDGTVYDPDGIDIERLVAAKRETGRVTDYEGGTKHDIHDWIRFPCEIFVPAARPDVIDETNALELDCKVVLQGANIPVTARAERILHDRNILSVPDFVANAGGVISASVEYTGGTQKRAFETIEEKITENTREVLQLAKAHSQIPAEAALALAKQRVAEAMAYRRSR